MTRSGPSDSSQASAHMSENRLRLRLCVGGQFVQTSDMQWKYQGGAVYNESVPAGSSYADFMFKMSEKCGAVQIKYQTPGEELDPQNLVCILDDSDLQELYVEYFKAVARCGSSSTTLRVKAFAFPAENIVFTEEDWMEQEYASYCERRATDLGTDGHSSWGSNQSTASEPSNSMWSANPSSDTEFQWGAPSATGGAAQPLWFGGEGSYTPMIAAQNLFSNMVWQNISKQPTYQGAGNECGALLYKDFPTEQYHMNCGYDNEQLMEEQVPGDGVGFSQGGEHLTSILHDIGGDDITCKLPSHISAFGEVSGDGREDLKLPSHISAFGDAIGVESGHYLEVVPPGTPAAGEFNDAGPGVYNNGILFRAHSKEVQTQVFNGSMDAEQSCRDGPFVEAPNDANLFAVEGGLGTLGSTSPTSLRQLGLSLHRVAMDEVTDRKKIGEGAFGEVSQAHVPLFGTVAVKWLKKERFSKHLPSFQNEARTLSELNHPNIIRFYGLVTETMDEASSVVGIMTEYVRGGSLAAYLRNRRRLNADTRLPTLSLRERCQLALHAANGMAYLHEKQVVHFDLKPDNLLVDGEGEHVTVKVADFGLSKHKWNSYVSNCRDLRGTLPYMAPELVANPEQVSEKADIWSMGVVMWEMYTLDVPFRELQAQQILHGLMHGNLHLALRETCEPEWRGLVEACMDANPVNRPSFRQLAKHLDEVIKQLPVM